MKGDSTNEGHDWLQQRQKSGNWIDIAESEEIPASILGPERTLLDMFRIAFAPEIRRRLSAAQLGDGFFLTAAQLILPENRGRTVRLNDEVRGLALVRASRTVHTGESVFLSDFRDLVSFDLADDELDAAHFTILWHGEGWAAHFDFRAGRAKSVDMLAAASQFLEAAKAASSKRHERPSVDNLFSACELVSKAHLILHRNPATQSKKHRAVKSAINNWVRFGNVSQDFVMLFNQMSGARAPARYDVGAQVQLPAQSDFKIVEQEIEHLTKSVAHRIDTGSPGPA